MLTKIASPILLLFILSTWAVAQQSTTGPSTKPSDAPAAVEAEVHPEALAGQAKAKEDLAAGVLAEVLPVPETFLLSWMRPGSKDSNLFDYYQSIVADRYGVKTDWVMFHAGLSDPVAWAAGYNGEMRPAIEAKFKRDVMGKAWREACGTSSGKRTKYLDDRKNGVKHSAHPSTRSATRPSGVGEEMNK